MLVELFNEIRESAIPALQIIEDRTYSTVPLTPVHLPVPKTLEVSNLSSLVEFVKNADTPSSTNNPPHEYPFIIRYSIPDSSRRDCGCES